MTTRWVLLLALLAGCSKPASTPPAVTSVPQYAALPEGAGTRVLFIGNSHTASNSLPAVVEAMAKAGGKRVLQRNHISGNTSLQDHLDRGAAKLLEAEKWDFVVLQQGPSSQPSSRAEIKVSAGEWGRQIRERGAKPALFMVWPVKGQANGFALVSQSYRVGAEAAGGVVFAAGEAWDAALKDDPELTLYAQDGSHAAPAGSYLAGLVITHGLVGVRPDAVPAKLDLGELGEMDIPEAVAMKLRRAATVVIDRPAK
jgi:hypothetical protein